MSHGPRILIADDDPVTLALLSEFLSSAGFEVVAVQDGAAVAHYLTRQRFDVLVLDHYLPGRTSLEILTDLQATQRAPEVVVITGSATVEIAVEVMKLGAFDFLAKPIDLDQLRLVIHRAAERRRLHHENAVLRQVVSQTPFTGRIVSESPKIREVLRKIEAVASSQAIVLFTGETGTGKGLMAKTLHKLSNRSKEPFLQVNCGALQETLFESELFGHRKGAFTGAQESKPGLFEVADGGTLFLDEVGELKPVMQAKLLQVLDTAEIRPVGGTAARKVDVRVVAATNRDLAEEVERGEFRRDLFFRLNVVSIGLPPLRERREDIALLMDYYVRRFEQPGRDPKRFSDAAIARMCAYDWPGNVRELANTVETAILLTPGPVIDVEDLPGHVRPQAAYQPKQRDEPLLSLAEVEKQHILAVIERTGGRKAEAARILEVDVKTLGRKLRSYGGQN